MEETRATWRLMLVLLLTNLVLRVSTLWQLVVNIDEPMLAQFAINMLRGDAPYTTMIGGKPFFLFLYYYAVLGLFGTFNLLAVHAVTILWVSATAVLVYAVLRQVSDRATAFSGAMIFSFATTIGDFKMISSDGETLMNLPLCASTLFLMMATRSRRWWHYAAAGVFASFGAQFRYQAGIQLAVLGSFLVLYEPIFEHEGAGIWRALAKGIGRFAIVLSAFVAAYAVVILYLWSVGSFESYVFWTLQFEFQYIRAGMKTINAIEKGALRTGLLCAGGFAVWFSAAQSVWGLRAIRRDPQEKMRRMLIVFSALWFVWGFVAVSTGGRFAMRYFTQLTPPLCLLAALSFPPAWCRFVRLPSWRVAWKRWALVTVVAILWALRFFSPQIYEHFGELDHASFQKEIGAYLAAHTEPDDLLYSWGWGNSIYFYAKRAPATRFINADFLTGRIAGSPTAYDANYDTSFNIVPGSWDMLMSDLERDKPAYIIDPSPANIHDYRKYPIARYPRLKEYLDKHYVFEKSLFNVDLYRRREPAS